MAGQSSSKLERSKLPSDVQDLSDEMHEREEKADDISNDAEVVGQTQGVIEGATVEGQTAEKAAIEEGMEITVNNYETEKSELENVHESAEELEADMEGGREIAEADTDKISEAGSKLKTDLAKEQLSEAESEAQSDIDLLSELIETERNEREQSQQKLEEYTQRVENAKGA